MMRIAFVFDRTYEDGAEETMTVADTKDGVLFNAEGGEFVLKIVDLPSLISALKKIQDAQPSSFD